MNHKSFHNFQHNIKNHFPQLKIAQIGHFRKYEIDFSSSNMAINAFCDIKNDDFREKGF